MRKPSESYLKLKKATDKILSGAGLVILSPVFAGIAIAIKLEDGITAPVFFKQKRVGIHKSHFMLYKFRSMQTDTPHDTPTHLLTDPEQYLTGTGRWLRKTSLDELPQLFNVLCNDMSLVGPRPLIESEIRTYYEDTQDYLLSVKPGVTGYWQAYARNNATYQSGERQKMEMYYVHNASLWLDIKILFKTIGSVLKKQGAQ
mgnify:CR=1 FL=1